MGPTGNKVLLAPLLRHPHPGLVKPAGRSSTVAQPANAVGWKRIAARAMQAPLLRHTMVAHTMLIYHHPCGFLYSSGLMSTMEIDRWSTGFNSPRGGIWDLRINRPGIQGNGARLKR
jgi:hypothetical protein